MIKENHDDSTVAAKLRRMGEINDKVGDLDHIISSISGGKLRCQLDGFNNRLELPDELMQSIGRQILAHYEYEKKLLIEEAEKIIKAS